MSNNHRAPTKYLTSPLGYRELEKTVYRDCIGTVMLPMSNQSEVNILAAGGLQEVDSLLVRI